MVTGKQPWLALCQGLANTERRAVTFHKPSSFLCRSFYYHPLFTDEDAENPHTCSFHHSASLLLDISMDISMLA